MIQSSFTGSIINPIIDGRLHVGLTSNALAKRMGLSKQYVSRTEKGTYSSLNPALLQWVANALSISKNDVMKRYVQFQKATRLATVERIDPHKLVRQDGSVEPGHVLFEHWRSGYWPSTVAFSNDFCVHSDTVRNYEEGIRKDMPTAIRSALLETNLLGPDFEKIPSEPGPTGARLRA